MKRNNYSYKFRKNKRYKPIRNVARDNMNVDTVVKNSSKNNAIKLVKLFTKEVSYRIIKMILL